MKLPGTPAATYQPQGDDRAFAAWLIRQVDKTPDALATIEPVWESAGDLAEIEAATRRALALAQKERPDLTARTLSPVPLNQPRPPAPRILLELHEHRFVGGECVRRGCGACREVDDPAPEA